MNADSVRFAGSQKHVYVNCPAIGRKREPATQETHWTNIDEGLCKETIGLMEL